MPQKKEMRGAMSSTPTTPVAFGFGYMHASGSHQPVLDKHSPGTSWRDVQAPAQ